MRRRDIIESGFGDERLFRSIRSNLSAGFSELVDDLDTKLQEAITTHLNVVQRDIDTLKDENVALESESNPALRRSLDAAVTDARASLASIHADVLSTTTVQMA
jgi:FtsZ-binding cell division protein ZapB